MPDIDPEFSEHYNQCMETLIKLEEMFLWLDRYRKTKDKRNLYAAKDYELLIRAEMKIIKNQNNKLINP